METPKKPHDEAARLQALHSLNILDTPAEERFDRITRLAKAMFGTEIALVSLVDADRQWFKSKQGLCATETSRAVSFCGHTILSDEIMWIENASMAPRFQANPLVLDAPHIRFYAGCPLRDRAGNRLGTLCLIDSSPRSENPIELERLKDLASIAEGVLYLIEIEESRADDSELSPGLRYSRDLSQEQRKERLDSVTGAWNRLGSLELIDAYLASATENQQPLTVLIAEIADEGSACKNWDAERHRLIIAEVAHELRGLVSEHDALGRIAGGSFALILGNISERELEDGIQLLRLRIQSNPLVTALKLRMNFGWVRIGCEEARHDAESVVSSARAELHSSCGLDDDQDERVA